MRRIAGLAVVLALGAAATLAATPAAAQRQKVFSGIVPATFLKKWSANLWVVWALPNGQCLELAQNPEETPFRFWGFRQSPGSRIDLIMGAIENPQRGTIQMSFNDGGQFDYAARVEQFVDWNAYVISIQSNALSIFHDDTFIDAYVGDEKVFWAVTHSLRNGEKVMQKCLDFQAGR
jgi:hypothetical protein